MRGAILQPTSGNVVLGLHRLSRDTRIVILLLAIGVMGLADLDMTIAYVTTMGMGEGNPLARIIMGTNSVAMVIAYKVVTNAIALTILYRTRHKRVSEWAAWAMFGVMAWLMIRWIAYNAGIAEMASMYVDASSVSDADWIVMDP